MQNCVCITLWKLEMSYLSMCLFVSVPDEGPKVGVGGAQPRALLTFSCHYCLCKTTKSHLQFQKVWSENISVWEEEWDTDNMSRISHGGSPGSAPFLPSIGYPSSLLSSYWSRPNIRHISLVQHFWTLDFYWFCTIWMKRYCGKQVNVLKYFRAGRNHQNPRAICSPSASAMCNRHWISHPMVAPISNLTTVLHPEKKTKTQMLP